MNELTIAFCNETIISKPVSCVSALLDKMEKHFIAVTPWADYSHRPRVQFSIAHAANCIMLKYYVNEKAIRAVNSTPNSPVYEDSCVEFFVSIDGKNYYNFEFNCIGACLAGYGEGRAGRQLLSPNVIEQIKYQSLSSKNTSDNSVDWELTVVIPWQAFIHDPISSLHEKKCRANFYKCGDLLPEPHYVCWSPIESPKPDFHLPAFFGNIKFE